MGESEPDVAIVPGRSAAALRVVEFVLMFLVAPSLLAIFMRRGLVFPAIWALSAICLAALVGDPTFDRRQLWNWKGLGLVWRGVAGRFAVGAALLTVILLAYEPFRFLQLPRQNLGLWGLVMVAYPLLSVYPQEVAFRAFVFHRYRGLFQSDRVLVAANALVFGYAHIILQNGWAMAFCAVGGVLFGQTYLRSRSLAAVCTEHAAYGCFLFTVGWGWYFYGGAVRP